MLCSTEIADNGHQRCQKTQYCRTLPLSHLPVIRHWSVVILAQVSDRHRQTGLETVALGSRYSAVEQRALVLWLRVARCPRLGSPGRSAMEPRALFAMATCRSPPRWAGSCGLTRMDMLMWRVIDDHFRGTDSYGQSLNVGRKARMIIYSSVCKTRQSALGTVLSDVCFLWWS